jgi:Ca2+/Na+ antiporter
LSDEFASFLLLGGSAVAFYSAARAAGDVLIPTGSSAHANAPAKRAIIHAAMTLIVGLVAIFHRPALLDIAVGVPFSAAVAAITLALGIVLFVAPPEPANGGFASRTARPKQIWAFLLPTGLLSLLIGFTGELTMRSGLMLAAEGAAILTVVSGSRSRSAASLERLADDSTDSARANIHPILALIQAIAAIVLAIIAAWGMVQGANGLALQSPAFRPGVSAVLALGPAIVLPMIPPLATLAERGRRDEATSSIVAFALLNICLVVPLLIIAHRLIPSVIATTQPIEVASLPFPILVWRLDTILLSTVGLLLLPTAIGRWTLSRGEGVALIGFYVLYLFLTLLISHS